MNATTFQLTLNYAQVMLCLRALERLAETTPNVDIEAQAMALHDDVLLQALGVSKND